MGIHINTCYVLKEDILEHSLGQRKSCESLESTPCIGSDLLFRTENEGFYLLSAKFSCLPPTVALTRLGTSIIKTHVRSELTYKCKLTI
jgi:hypothetical protein